MLIYPSLSRFPSDMDIRKRLGLSKPEASLGPLRKDTHQVLQQASTAGKPQAAPAATGRALFAEGRGAAN